VSVTLEVQLARRAAKIAREHRLRGSDSIYVAVAEAVDAVLVTWDVEVIERSPAGVRVLTPAQWLEKTQPPRP
jgi:predicted nucleic acid-binding protein